MREGRTKRETERGIEEEGKNKKGKDGRGKRRRKMRKVRMGRKREGEEDLLVCRKGFWDKDLNCYRFITEQGSLQIWPRTHTTNCRDAHNNCPRQMCTKNTTEEPSQQLCKTLS